MLLKLEVNKSLKFFPIMVADIAAIYISFTIALFLEEEVFFMFLPFITHF